MNNVLNETERLKEIAIQNYISGFGKLAELKPKIDVNEFSSQVIEFNNSWLPYNPSKDIKREGLSLTSLDGKMSGRPDLDSLLEHYRETGVAYSEEDFKLPTKAYEKLKSLHSLFQSFPKVGRSHLIKFGAGGFFPPHRDAYGSLPKCFRIVSFLTNCTSDTVYLTHDGETLNLNQGSVYYLDTRKIHAVFSFVDNAIILVMNIPMTIENLDALEIALATK